MALKDGYNELGGSTELVKMLDGLPVQYSSLSQYLPTVEEEADIAARIAALTGMRVRLEQWVLEEGDPRDSGRNAVVVVIGNAGK